MSTNSLSAAEARIVVSRWLQRWHEVSAKIPEPPFDLPPEIVVATPEIKAAQDALMLAMHDGLQALINAVERARPDMPSIGEAGISWLAIHQAGYLIGLALEAKHPGAPRPCQGCTTETLHQYYSQIATGFAAAAEATAAAVKGKH